MNAKDRIYKELKKAPVGLVISNLIDITGLSRGCIKMNLLYLMVDNKVEELAYNKNNKVYKIKSYNNKGN